jgi:hypothetical protein
VGVLEVGGVVCRLVVSTFSSRGGDTAGSVAPLETVVIVSVVIANAVDAVGVVVDVVDVVVVVVVAVAVVVVDVDVVVYVVVVGLDVRCVSSSPLFVCCVANSWTLIGFDSVVGVL